MCWGAHGKHVEVVATGLTVPWSLAMAPDGRVFVNGRPGRIRVISGDKLADAPWVTMAVLDGNAKSAALRLAR